VRALVIVITDPEPGPLPRLLKAPELRTAEEIGEDAPPETLHLSQSHGMVRPGFDVKDPILLHLHLEFGLPPPVGVLAALIGEHLLGGRKFPRSDPIDIDDILCGLASEKIRAADEAGVVVHKRDEIRVLPSQAKGKDVALPELVGGGPLKEAGLWGIAFGPGLGLLDEFFFVQGPAHGFMACLEAEDPAQGMGDAPYSKAGMALLELDNFLFDRRGILFLLGGRPQGFEAFFPHFLVSFGPTVETALAHPELLLEHGGRKPLFEVKLYGFEPKAEGIMAPAAGSPLGGAPS